MVRNQHIKCALVLDAKRKIVFSDFMKTSLSDKKQEESNETI